MIPFSFQQGGFGLVYPPAAGGGSGINPDFANVSSLLHFDGTDGSTTFTDVTGKTWTANGNAQIDTAAKQFGTGAGIFDGSGDWIQTGSDAGFGFESGAFTIEGWFMRTGGATTNPCMVDTRTGSNAGVGIYASTSIYSGLSYANNGGTIAGSGTAFTVDVFEHWAVVRETDGFTVRGYVNGVQVFTVSDSRTLASASTCFVGDNYVAPSQPMLGSMDDLRITKGECLYPGGTTFTPPTAAFPDS